ncbi:MAG: hypothetical protein ACE5JF_08980 [Anaerolineales bacterium]
MSVRGWALILAAFSAVERILIYLLYAPVGYGDTATYQRLATALGHGGLPAYDATRVPGYPVFIMALGSDPEAVRAAQMALGWITAMLLFWLGWRSTGSAVFGFVLGMLYNLLANQVLVESVLLSESLTTFLVVASLAGLVSLAQARRYVSALALILGLAAAAAGLVRALFYPLAPWLALFLARSATVDALPSLFEGQEHGADSARFRVIRLGLYAIIPLVLLGGWLANVNSRYGMLSPSTMSGYHLVQHTGEYFHLLPDEHAAIRDTYIKYRDERIAERGDQTNAIWDAIPELTEVSGLSFFDLSREMQVLSLLLIRTHPQLYAANAAEGWVDFWKAPTLWKVESLRASSLSGLFSAWVLVSRAVALTANAAFLLLSSALVVSQRVRERIRLDWIFAASAGLVWLSSVVQTLVDHGDNPRFLVPLQIIVFFVILRTGFNWIQRIEHRI